MDLPSKEKSESISLNDFAVIDEISGLTTFLNAQLQSNDIPEVVKDRIRARMFIYKDNGIPKE